MSKLTDYLMATAIQCPRNEGADVVFFGVKSANGATADELREAMAGHKGEFCDMNPLDGKEHSYIELGAWVGDQGLALSLIGLGAQLELWKLLTPKTMFGDIVDADLEKQMAGMGYVLLLAAN